jgi:uncharacterized protein (DUF1015 family)
LAEIREFPGIIYDVAKAGPIGDLVCPPYDVISPEQQERYYEASPYNVIRIELGKEFPGDTETENKYTRAAAFLEAWLRDGILVTDTPSLYLYLQDFEWDGRRYSRPGVVGAVRLHEFSERVILPHEKTLSKPKEDRFNLMKATRANVSHIFGFFSDATGRARQAIEKARRTEPLFSFVDDDGVTHSLFRIPEEAAATIKDALASERIFIADGHHRYETALRYRATMRETLGTDAEGPWDFVMMTVVPVEADLLVLPIHRTVRLPEALSDSALLEKLEPYFDIRIQCGPAHLREALANEVDTHVFGMITRTGEYVLALKQEHVSGATAAGTGKGLSPLETLPSNLLQRFAFERALGIALADLESVVSFTSDFTEAQARAKADPRAVSFILKPVSVETIKDVSLNLETMPQKTTYFYPKVWTGLVMRRLED